MTVAKVFIFTSILVFIFAANWTGTADYQVWVICSPFYAYGCYILLKFIKGDVIRLPYGRTVTPKSHHIEKILVFILGSYLVIFSIIVGLFKGG